MVQSTLWHPELHYRIVEKTNVKNRILGRYLTSNVNFIGWNSSMKSPIFNGLERFLDDLVTDITGPDWSSIFPTGSTNLTWLLWDNYQDCLRELTSIDLTIDSSLFAYPMSFGGALKLFSPLSINKRKAWSWIESDR
jgi:hypothetical protein